MSETNSQLREESNNPEKGHWQEQIVTENTKTYQASLPLCNSCNRRRAREGCTIRCCVTCCDDTTCDVHMKSKEQKAWKERVLAATTDVQKRAAQLRKRCLIPGTFREPLFTYVGESIVLWDLRIYARNSKQREEAIRKSKRRSAGMILSSQKSKQRCLAEIVDELYEKLLTNSDL